MKLLKTLALILCLSFVFTLVSCDDTKSSKDGLTFEQCKRIAMALDTSMDYLAGLTDVKEPYPPKK